MSKQCKHKWASRVMSFVPELKERRVCAKCGKVQYNKIVVPIKPLIVKLEYAK